MKSIQINKFPSLNYAGQEALNTLCTNLSFTGESIKKIMVTSSHASEGKSYLTMNIMRTMAKYGKTVAFVDADLRRSFICSRYGITFEKNEHKEGLAHLLAGMTEEEDVVYKTNIPNTLFVPVGREVSNPVPLLNSERFGLLLDNLAASVDYVLVDAPPVGTVIDAAEIAKSCDGTLLVVGYNNVTRRELLDSKQQLDQTGCPILGTVLNMVELDNYINRKYYYKSYHSYYSQYGDGDEKKQGE